MTDKELVMSKIDWKFFNFLKDKATLFEDDGHIITIYAIVRFINKTYSTANDTYLYRYENGSDKEYDMFLEEYKLLRQRLEFGGELLYLIKCVATGTGYDEQASKLGTDYYGKIKSKCTIQTNERLGVFTVKPN